MFQYSALTSAPMQATQPRSRLPRSRNTREWSIAEDNLLRALFPDYAVLEAKLPGRSYDALRNRARTLSLVTPRHIWTQLEVARLKRLWRKRGTNSAELTSAFPGMTLSQIKIKARNLHLGARPRCAPKILDVHIIDQIRWRAHDEGMSLVDLDEIAGTGRYFQRCKRQIVWKHILAAVEVLGGRIEVNWLDDEDFGEAPNPVRRIA